MALTIDPTIPLGIRPQASMTLPQMLDLARGAQAFQQAQQVFPEQAEQARIATRTAQTQEQQAMLSLSKDQNNTLMGIVGGYRNDPRIASGNPDAALAALDEIKAKAVAAGIPRSRVEQIGTTATSIAINDPKRLPQYFDNVIQTSAGPSAQLGLQTPELVTSGGAPALLRRGPGTLEEPRLIEGAPKPSAPASQGVTPEMLTAPITPKAAPIAPQAAPVARPQAAPADPGYSLRFPPRAAGDIRPFAPGEENARATGEKTRTALVEAQSSVPKAQRSVSEVIRVANDLAKDVRFQTGRPADIERAIRTTLGEDRYKELSKDIANAQLALLKAEGGNLETDAGKALVARATGDETYPPDVLVKIARRLNGQLAEVDARATGAQAFARRFGDANLPEFQQTWSKNSDLRIFEMMAAVRDIRNPKDQKAALDAILPKNPEELREMMQKYENIKRLTATGTLR
jgi:hypothetical protein